jgi:5S rRNA maturation endonuclease (ribonuclease M5)
MCNLRPSISLLRRASLPIINPKSMREHVSGVKHAYLDREKAKNKRGKIGVEHAHPKDISSLFSI